MERFPRAGTPPWTANGMRRRSRRRPSCLRPRRARPAADWRWSCWCWSSAGLIAMAHPRARQPRAGRRDAAVTPFPPLPSSIPRPRSRMKNWCCRVRCRLMWSRRSTRAPTAICCAGTRTSAAMSSKGELLADIDTPEVDQELMQARATRQQVVAAHGPGEDQR